MQVFDAFAELDVGGRERFGHFPHGGSRFDQVSDFVQVSAVALCDAAVSKLGRSKVAGLRLGAVGDVLVSGPARCFHVSTREKSHLLLQSGEAHGLVELAVALDVDFSGAGAFFCLADSVAHNGRPQYRPVEDDLDGDDACADVGDAIASDEVFVDVAREAVASVHSGHGREWLRQLGAGLKRPCRMVSRLVSSTRA